MNSPVADRLANREKRRLRGLATGGWRTGLVLNRDYHRTPEETITALVDAEGPRFPRFVWDATCGICESTEVLRREGIDVLSTDLVEYGTESQDVFGADFLHPNVARAVLDRTRSILIHPPVGQETAFVRAAKRSSVDPFYVLTKLAFLEGVRRRDLLVGAGLRRVYPFIRRIPPLVGDGDSGYCPTPMAWFVYQPRYRGPVELESLDWETPAARSIRRRKEKQHDQS